MKQENNGFPKRSNALRSLAVLITAQHSDAVLITAQPSHALHSKESWRKLFIKKSLTNLEDEKPQKNLTKRQKPSI